MRRRPRPGAARPRPASGTEAVPPWLRGGRVCRATHVRPRVRTAAPSSSAPQGAPQGARAYSGCSTAWPRVRSRCMRIAARRCATATYCACGAPMPARRDAFRWGRDGFPSTRRSASAAAPARRCVRRARSRRATRPTRSCCATVLPLATATRSRSHAARRSARTARLRTGRARRGSSASAASTSRCSPRSPRAGSFASPWRAGAARRVPSATAARRLSSWPRRRTRCSRRGAPPPARRCGRGFRPACSQTARRRMSPARRSRRTSPSRAPATPSRRTAWPRSRMRGRARRRRRPTGSRTALPASCRTERCRTFCPTAASACSIASRRSASRRGLRSGRGLQVTSSSTGRSARHAGCARHSARRVRSRSSTTMTGRSA